MIVSYCEGWFRAKKCTTRPLNESEAQKAYDSRKLHCAVIGKLDKPQCFVEFNRDYVGVGFLDERLRDYLDYSFQEFEPGRLFLTMATHRAFDAETDHVKSGTTYYFKPDGQVTVETEDFATGQLSTKIMQTDVTGNWEAYPTFGDYQSLVRADR